MTLAWNEAALIFAEIWQDALHIELVGVKVRSNSSAG